VSDWTDGFSAHIHILAPSTYIFFASVIPALTFGEQLADETGGQVGLVLKFCPIHPRMHRQVPIAIVYLARDCLQDVAVLRWLTQRLWSCLFLILFVGNSAD
jgi:hypothetical protein